MSVLCGRKVLLKPRIARGGSSPILLRETCCPLSRQEGLVAEFMLRWFHFLAGITWIGLLYYFNFVQGPFMAEADPAAKSTVTQKLLPRALRWFRGGAIVTFLTGILIISKRLGESPLGAAASGGQANAASPVAARRAFLASRTNVVFSIPMLFFMGAASHFTLPGGGNHALYWASVIV